MTLAERLRHGLASAAPNIYLPGDHHDFDPNIPGRAAAVLIAITDRAEPGVVLTQRTETLRKHPGQVAFPGGSIDPEDGGPIIAALREAEEEIALPRGEVEIIDTLERYRTVTGFDVTPVLGTVRPNLKLIPAEAEVADVFEVPLAFLLNPANHRQAHAIYQGKERRYYEILWEDRRIWGATAAMIINLSRRLNWLA